MANLQFSVHGQRLDEPRERGAATTSAALDWLGVLGGKVRPCARRISRLFCQFPLKECETECWNFLVFKKSVRGRCAAAPRGRSVLHDDCDDESHDDVGMAAGPPSGHNTRVTVHCGAEFPPWRLPVRAKTYLI